MDIIDSCAWIWRNDMGQLSYRNCGDLTISANISVFCIPCLILATRTVIMSDLDAFETGSRELVPRIYFCRDRPSSRYQRGRIPARRQPLEKRWRSERRGGPPRRSCYETCVFRLSGAHWLWEMHRAVARDRCRKVCDLLERSRRREETGGGAAVAIEREAQPRASWARWIIYWLINEDVLHYGSGGGRGRLLSLGTGIIWRPNIYDHVLLLDRPDTAREQARERHAGARGPIMMRLDLTAIQGPGISSCNTRRRGPNGISVPKLAGVTRRTKGRD